jgi:hypothetical protein
VALKQALGFSAAVIDTPLPSSAVVDMVTVSDGTAGPPTTPPFAPTPAAAGETS